MGGFGGGFGGLGLFGGLLSVLLTLGLLVGLVLLGIWLWRRYGKESDFGFGPRPMRHEPTPREILEARYARSELTRQEFQTMLRDLSES